LPGSHTHTHAQGVGQMSHSQRHATKTKISLTQPRVDSGASRIVSRVKWCACFHLLRPRVLQTFRDGVRQQRSREGCQGERLQHPQEPSLFTIYKRQGGAQGEGYTSLHSTSCANDLPSLLPGVPQPCGNFSRDFLVRLCSTILN